MKIKGLVKLLFSGRLVRFRRLLNLVHPFYKLSYLASAKNNGLSDLLAGHRRFRLKRWPGISAAVPAPAMPWRRGSNSAVAS